MKADVIVIGLGAMGASTAYQLAKRGAKVLGVDRYSPPHSIGSTHGDTRVTRLATVEGAVCVPLVLRSHEIWRELENETGRDLFTACGMLEIGAPGATLHGASGLVEKSSEFAKQFGIAHEVLDAPALRDRFPQFKVSEGQSGYFEPGSGFVRPEACVSVQLEAAKRHGAEVLLDERVVRLNSMSHGVSIQTDSGQTHHAGSVVLASGQWIGQLGGALLAAQLEVRRAFLCWFEVEPSALKSLSMPEMPVFIWGGSEGADVIYGFPAIDGAQGGIKVAPDNEGVPAEPDTPRVPVSPEESVAFYRSSVRTKLVGVGPRCLRSVVCHYTVTPDHDFIIDRHPKHENVVVVSACSGHGFKHSAGIGESVAQMLLEGRSQIDLSAFRLARFAHLPIGG